MMKKIGLSDFIGDVKIEIHAIVNEKNDPPILLVSETRNDKKKEHLCKSIIVGDIEYVAQYNRWHWSNKNECGNANNPQVKLPNGNVVSREEFEKRFGDDKEILI